MSQSAVADRLGVNRSTVSVRESGSENIGFSLDALQPHLDALGAHLRLEFVDGPGDVEVSAAGRCPLSWRTWRRCGASSTTEPGTWSWPLRTWRCGP